MQPALEHAIAELMLGAAVTTDDLDALLDRHPLDADERHALKADFARWVVYRGLVRNTLKNAVALAIPRSLFRLGPLFDEFFERFLRERGPRTHYLRDVTTELLDFVQPLWRNDARVPPWMHDLARHEALEIVIASQADPIAAHALGELDAERGLSFIEAARVVRYDFAVHRLSADEHDVSAPERAPTALFVYRDPAHDVRYLELTPVAAALLEQLLAGDTLKTSLLKACAATATEPSSALTGAAVVLSDLSARGALLGPRATGLAGGPTKPDDAPIGGQKEPHE